MRTSPRATRASRRRSPRDGRRGCTPTPAPRRTVHRHRPMTTSRRFTGPELDALDRAKILGVRAGTDHKFTGVWVVVVERRVFVRSWNDKPTGWFRALRAAPHGTIVFGGKGEREIPIRARA